MNKKILSVLVMAVALSATSLFALGIGAQAGYVAGPNHSNGALTFKLDSSPWVFALNVDGLSTDYVGIGLTADRWIANRVFASPLAYFYGFGFAGSVYSYNDTYSYLFVGARALFGINVFVIDGFLELYAQAAWQPGVNFYGNNTDRAEIVVNSFPVNLGFRFWI